MKVKCRRRNLEELSRAFGGKNILGNFIHRVPRNGLAAHHSVSFVCDEYLRLRGPLNAPIIKEAVRWKFTPMGWDAMPQIWYTGLTNSHNRDTWYTLTNGIGREAYHRWQKSHAERERTLPPAYAQHLRESSWYDPIIPAQYLEPSTRWGAFRWKDTPVLGKEYGIRGASVGTWISPVPSPVLFPLHHTASQGKHRLNVVTPPAHPGK
uniref:Chromosome 19 open reading frame 71 n=1 Tax=Varanus komodoensis TaxID=61221 RepID=A0A8D2JBG6_VARKO